MSSDRVLDFLTEELVVGKNIVTYRSLSHALCMHVNQAKNELAIYHSDHAGSLDAAHATYIIGGEPRISYLDSVRDTDEMIIDDEATDEHSEDVPETKITLVNEADLETSKEQYARIDFVHIYSLSPSRIHEPALLCEPAKSLREAGKSVAAGFTVELGRITGPSWYIKKRTDLQAARSSANIKSTTSASTSKNRLPGLSKAPSSTEDTKPIVKSEPRDVKLELETKEEPPKAKPSGKLDFSKAKPAPKPAPQTRKVEPAESSTASKAAAPKPERRASRNSTLKLSDSEHEESARERAKPPSERTESKSAARLKKGVVISDDEDSEAPKPPRAKAAYKTKAKAASSNADADKELRAMMDIDDDHVTKVSRAVSLSEPATSPPATDVEMEDRAPAPAPAPAPEPEPEPESEPARAPTRRKAQRKPKKEVPVGRNGLKKRRVVKSRMTTDDKGYFVTEDYSSYESVDEEEEPPPQKPAKGKGKKITASSSVVVKNEGDTDEKAAQAPAKNAPALKRKSSKPGVQKGGIASYFSKK
ncbi:DNA polymerase subunit Cdc27 [Russula compacta]|nr:DNA polymerase subunit Cdc27 [Russula compacta]